MENLSAGAAGVPGEAPDTRATSGAAVTRYRDAYRVANITVSAGSAVKAIGYILAALAALLLFQQGGAAD